jgi:hypothetical protein
VSDINLTDRIRINRRPDHHTEHDSGLRLLAFNDRERQGVLKDRTNPISLSILVGEYDAEAWITLQETINFQYELAWPLPGLTPTGVTPAFRPPSDGVDACFSML